MPILAGLSFITAVGLLILTVRVQKFAPWAPHPKRLRYAITAGFASSVVLAISLALWTILLPIFHVWYPLGWIVTAGNVANLISGIFLLLEFTAEGVLGAVLMGINQILWVLLGLLAATVNF
jgi:hypothetical protein